MYLWQLNLASIRLRGSTPRYCCFYRLLLAVASLALVVTTTAQASQRPPNIVFLLTDDHPWTEYGFMGSEVAHTPNIDELASQSVRFINGYVPSSVCRPSLGVLLTGLYPHQSGIWFNASPRRAQDRNAAHLIADLPSLPRLLAERGYASLQTGKHWEGDYLAAGFTEGTTVYRNGKRSFNGTAPDGQKIGRDTLEPIVDFVDRQVASATPFFLWYGVYLPHAPANAPEKYRRLFAEMGLDDAEVAYHANIAWLDDTIGQLMSYFETKGIMEDTLFVLLTDNGMTIHADPWWGGPGGKTSTGEMGLRSPILLRWDGRVEPGTHEQLVSSIDFVPTVLDAAGVPRDELQFPGENLVELAKKDRSTAERPVFGAIYNPNPRPPVGMEAAQAVAYRWVRHGDWKLITPENLDRREVILPGWPKINAVKASDHFTEVRLFHLADDPGETNNLAESKPDKLAELRELLDAWWNPNK